LLETHDADNFRDNARISQDWTFLFSLDPGIARDFVFVEDICEAFLLAAAHPQSERGTVYNVGSGVQTTLREIVELARRRLDIAAEPAAGFDGRPTLGHRDLGRRRGKDHPRTGLASPLYTRRGLRPHREVVQSTTPTTDLT
jgi:nucleoside-diphosphate-sugar epimerase